MKICITGANGQMGMNILQQFLPIEEFENTVALNGLVTPSKSHYKITALYHSNLNSLPLNIHKHKFDLTTFYKSEESKARLQSVLEKQDIVIHAAGYINICPKNQKEIETLYEVNSKGTIEFIKLCEQAKVKTYVHISSIEALLSEGYFHDKNLTSKEHTTYYGECKAEATIYAKQSSIPNKVIVFPSGIISKVFNKPSPLMEFIYSIPNSYFQFYPTHEFYFVDGEYMAEKIKNTCDDFVIYNTEKSYTELFMLGKKSTIGEIVSITKRVNDNEIFPLSYPIPNTLLWIFSFFGDIVGSPTINSTVFSILNSVNLLPQTYRDNPPLIRTLMNTFFS